MEPSDYFINMPHKTIFQFYEGDDALKYDLLSGENLNRPIQQLWYNQKSIAEKLDALSLNTRLVDLETKAEKAEEQLTDIYKETGLRPIEVVLTEPQTKKLESVKAGTPISIQGWGQGGGYISFITDINHITLPSGKTSETNFLVEPTCNQEIFRLNTKADRRTYFKFDFFKCVRTGALNLELLLSPNATNMTFEFHVFYFNSQEIENSNMGTEEY